MNSGPPTSSIQDLWNILNATQDRGSPSEECQEGGRFCTQAGVVANRGDSSGGLESEVFTQAKRGFGALSLAMALAAVVSFTATQLLSEITPPLATTLCQTLMFVASLAMFGLTRHPNLCPRRVARFGQAYQVGGALIIALSAFGSGVSGHLTGELPTLPPVAAWLAVWIVVFPLVAPARPWQTILLAFASASTVPVVLVGVHLLGAAEAHLVLSQVVLASSLFFAAAGVAVVPALMIQGLSRGISVARHQLSNLRTYQLLEQIGQGGMGEVWLAEHKLLKRPAAIKIVKPQRLAGASLEERSAVLTRFEREATTTASLRSPHTVDLYDFGRTEVGDFFYVMELLDGDTLEELVEHHGPLPAERVVHLLEQACASLAEAHQRGLVHRDLKPANLMACRLGLQVDFLKVLDFGLVATVRQSSSDPKLTGDDAILGTPAYMAPEQGRGDPADARSDVYALGCVAYWLLTGSTVFTREKAIPMILDHIGTAPTPPSERTEQEIPADLEALIMECLAKEPADRPPSALDLAGRLRRIVLPTPWTPERADAWWEAHHHESHGEPSPETQTHDPGVVQDPALAPTILMGSPE